MEQMIITASAPDGKFSSAIFYCRYYEASASHKHGIRLMLNLVKSLVVIQRLLSGIGPYALRADRLLSELFCFAPFRGTSMHLAFDTYACLRMASGR